MDILNLLADPVFRFNAMLSGWMVSIDAIIFLVVAMMAVPKGKHFMMVVLITLAHAVYGYLGLAVEAGVATKLSITIAVVLSSYAGLRFIVEGLSGDEDDPLAKAKILTTGLYSLAAFGVYSGISVDELFAVLQRFQWMEAQGWSIEVMAYNIGASMVVLFALLLLTMIILRAGFKLTHFEKRGDGYMFIVFGLIMYYMVRAVWQNIMGNTPLEVPNTGIAYYVLAVGFLITFLLWLALKNEFIKNVFNAVLLISDDEDEESEA